MIKTMTKTATVRARMNPSVKKRAEAVLRKIGITPSEAISVFYHRVATEKAVPFSLHVPNAETRAVMRALERGEGKRVTLEEFVEDMRKAARIA